ncbi:MAG: PqqD family protein [Candidatus Riflebacteria bacterium]|nr:PqqD family protein [Candidatus Riflebacteria bacterium]
MTQETRVKIKSSDELISTPVKDELVMMNVETGKYFGLNHVATTVWQNLQNEISVADLCEKVCSEFEVSPEVCRSEVMAFLETLHQKDLISVVK